MGGGLLQLVSYGAQDVFLTGSPQVTFFRSLYRRHTHFAIESIRCSFTGGGSGSGSSFGTDLKAEISRNGDLLHRLYLEVTLPASRMSATADVDKWAYVRNLGHVIMEEARVEIGGQQIDKITGRFDNLWNALTLKSDKKVGFYHMTGTDTDPVTSDSPLELTTETTFYLPISFWFSGSNGTGGLGQALPLIALQYHQVVLYIKTAPVKDMIRRLDDAGNAANPSVVVSPYTKSAVDDAASEMTGDKIKLYADFVFLDTAERRRFAQTSHEYLVTQLQERKEILDANGNNTIQLPFNHPTKCLMWSLYRAESDKYNMFNPLYNGFMDPNSYPYAAAGDMRYGSNNNPIAHVELKLNNQDRFEKRKGSYFSLVQPFQHAPVIPENNWLGIYSFSLDISEFQPSGTLNLSRVDDCRLILDIKDPSNTNYLSSPTEANIYKNGAVGKYDAYIYAVNLNVFRVISGMGGLAFSN